MLPSRQWHHWTLLMIWSCVLAFRNNLKAFPSSVSRETRRRRGLLVLMEKTTDACDSLDGLDLDIPKRIHESTIAIVPPSLLPEDVDGWDRISAARRKLLDRGYFRWPPHINLIYPFTQPKFYKDVMPRLAKAVEQFEPFEVSMSEFGIFGGKSRGVLWLDPTPTDPNHKLTMTKIQNALEKALWEFEREIVQQQLVAAQEQTQAQTQEVHYEDDVYSTRTPSLATEGDGTTVTVIIEDNSIKNTMIRDDITTISTFSNTPSGTITGADISVAAAVANAAATSATAATATTTEESTVAVDVNTVDQSIIDMVAKQRMDSKVKQYLTKPLGNRFRPHMTLSHFDTASDAEEAIDRVKDIVGALYHSPCIPSPFSQENSGGSGVIKTSDGSSGGSNSDDPATNETLPLPPQNTNSKPFTFTVREVYVMQRHDGWNDQFRIVYTLPLLGKKTKTEEETDENEVVQHCVHAAAVATDDDVTSTNVTVSNDELDALQQQPTTTTVRYTDINIETAIYHGDDGLRFPLMPVAEDDWVRVSRLQYKSGRKGSRRTRGGASKIPPLVQKRGLEPQNQEEVLEDAPHYRYVVTGDDGNILRSTPPVSVRTSVLDRKSERRQTTDTPDQIAEKRASRAAKRDALARLDGGPERKGDGQLEG